MKTLILSIALCLSFSLFTVSAQKGERGERKGGKNFKKELNLTAEQKEKMKSVHKDFRAKVEELNKNTSLSKDDKSAKRKELRENHQAEVKKILTAEQQQKYAQMHKNRKKADGNRKEMRHHMKKDGKHTAHNRRHMKKGEPMMKSLDLTDAQKDKLKALRKEYAMKEKDLKQNQKVEMMKVLTPEQVKKMNQLKTEKIAQKNKVTTQGAEKLNSLRENFEKERGAIERSRIAPEAQKQKMKELGEKYKKDRRQIIDQHGRSVNQPS